jgi:phosphoenolpyruvate carboxykinase (GTP)
MPRYDDIHWKGLDFPRETFQQLQTLDRDAWRAEVLEHEELFLGLHDHLPPEIIYERELLICRLFPTFTKELAVSRGDHLL